MRVHHRKGRNVLYVDQGYTVKINGMSEDEIDILLEHLYEHALRPNYIIVTNGTLTVWLVLIIRY